MLPLLRFPWKRTCQGSLHIACPMPVQGSRSHRALGGHQTPCVCGPHTFQGGPAMTKTSTPRCMYLPAEHSLTPTPGQPQSYIFLVHPGWWSCLAGTGWPYPVLAQQTTTARIPQDSPTQGSLDGACPRAPQASQVLGSTGLAPCLEIATTWPPGIPWWMASGQGIMGLLMPGHAR